MMTDRGRHIVRYAAAAALYYSGALALCRRLRRERQQRSELIVLGFHRVLTADERAASNSEASMTVLLPTFVRLLEILRRDFAVVSLAQVQSGELPVGKKPLCLLTFDDAWQDTFVNATPALRRAGLTAVVFVPTALLGSSERFWVEKLGGVWRHGAAAQNAVLVAVRRGTRRDVDSFASVLVALKELPLAERDAVVDALGREWKAGVPSAVDRFMTWEQLAAGAPQLEIGSHTARHVLLDREDEPTARHELAESRSELWQRMHKEVRALAYPNGNHNERVRGWAREAGYEWGFSVRPGIFREGGDRMQVPRMLIQESNLTNPWGGFSAAMTHLRLMGWR